MLLKSFVTQIIIICLLVALSQNQNHFSRKFTDLIQANSKTFYPLTTLPPTGFFKTTLRYGLLFNKAKINNLYTYAISFQDIYLGMSSYCFSIELYNFSKYKTSIYVSITGQCSNQFDIITYRYLIVMPEMSSAVVITHLDQSFSPSRLIQDSSNNKIVLISTAVMSNTDYNIISVFSGYTIKNKRPNYYIDLYTTILPDANLKIQVTGTSTYQQLYVYHIALYVIGVKKSFLIKNMTGAFQVGVIPFSSTRSSNSHSLYNSGTVFIGTSKIRNRHDNSKIDYSIMINPDAISITITNVGALNTYEFSYINFIYLPCNTSSTYYYEQNKTCITECPMICDVYPAPYLCGVCSECTNGTYKANNSCNDCKSQCLTCISQQICTSCAETYTYQNDKCIPNCSLIDNTTFLGLNNTCESCPDSCLQCSNLTSCNLCDTSFYLDNGTCIFNCSIINQSLFLQNQTCVNCSSQCLTCSNLTYCLSCIDLYKLENNSCVVNCSIVNECLRCNLAQNNTIFCTECIPGSMSSKGVCVSKCGDGFYHDDEECDDGNLQDGDGCDSNCQVQTKYWNCSSVIGNISTCILKKIEVSSSFVLKSRRKNSITIHIDIYPNPKILDNLLWYKGITANTSFLKLSYQNGYYDRQTSKLILEYSYQQDLTDKEAQLQFIFSNIDTSVSLISPTKITVSMIAQNNLALRNYSSQIYTLGMMIEGISLAIASISLLIFLCGYFSGRLIALQNIAIIQITYLCLLDIKQANPTFEALRVLRISIGSVSFNTYDYSSNINPTFKGAYIGLSLLYPPNFSYIFILIPLMIGVTLVILQRIKWKDSKMVQLASLTVLGQYTFYGLVFAAYFIFSTLIVGLVLINGENVSRSISNIVVSMFLTISICIYCVLLKKYPQYFGVFTRSLSKYGIANSYYIFVVVQKFLSTIVIVLFRDIVFGLGIQMIIIFSLFIFLLYNKPFVESNYNRQKINYISLLLILCLSLLSKIMVKNNIMQDYIPLGICLLLLISTISSMVYMIQQIKKTISQFCPAQSQNPSQNPPSFLQSMFKIKENQCIQQKNQFQFQIFERKLFGDSQQLNLIFKQQAIKQIQESCKNKQMLEYQWDRYDVLSKNKPVEDIRSRLKTKIINTQAI